MSNNKNDPKVEKQKWKLPSEQDGYAFMVRSNKAEMHLRQSLDLLHKIMHSIPHQPASKIKSDIKDHLKQFYETT